MDGDAKRYEQRGVSADKGDVHAAIKMLDEIEASESLRPRKQFIYKPMEVDRNRSRSGTFVAEEHGQGPFPEGILQGGA